MKKKQPKNDSPKPPRTVQQMVPWLNSQFGSLKNLMRQLVGLKPADEHFGFQAPQSRDVTVREFFGSLQQALSQLETLLTEVSTPALEAVTISDFTRAMLLTGNGERFEPAIRSAIRAYADTCQEQFRFTHQSGIPQNLREDILAGFARVSGTQEQDLRILGVEVRPVAEGTKIDPTCHQVVKQLATDDPTLLDTIRHCITPIFRWKSDHVYRVEPARVTAYTTLKERPLPARKHAPEKNPTGFFPESSAATGDTSILE